MNFGSNCSRMMQEQRRHKFMELNEKEKNIVDLIGKLADAASDESTTQETIDHIMANIQNKSDESARADIDAAEKNTIPTPKVKFPESNFENDFKRAMGESSCSCGQHHNHTQGKTALNHLLFTRIREVKAPTKAHPTDAGIDFFVPDKKAWDDDFRDTVMKYSNNKEISGFAGISFEGYELVVMPNAHVAIPSGIKTIIPQGLAMMMVNKSGVATKLKLDHSACLIDSEYRDELIFCFFNHNVEPVKIEPGMKITQGLIVPVINLKLQECLNCVYDDIAKGSDRGGGFGSSGTK